MMQSEQQAGHVFKLLASAELGSWPAWDVPDKAGYMQPRIEALATLLDIVSRSDLVRLEDIGRAWCR